MHCKFACEDAVVWKSEGTNGDLRSGARIMKENAHHKIYAMEIKCLRNIYGVTGMRSVRTT